MIRVLLPVRLVTLENQREHWAQKAKRAKEQRKLVHLALLAKHGPSQLAGALMVTLTRLAPRKLDPGNLEGSFKHVQDGVADWLCRDDGHASLTWVYKQESAGANAYACEVSIEPKE